MTDGADRGTPPLTVAADLTLTVGGVEATLRSTGERLFLEFPSLVAAVRAFRSVPGTERRHLHGALTAADLAFEIRARNRTLAVLGVGATPGPLAHQFGLDPAEIRLCGPVSAAWAGALAAGRRRQ
ncbi:hypothetical protein SY89_02889 [Halolamina pelagica]|uniref:Uncharacterized protein n=1 Tax=Halolamina pelagica TaxID=699431 RepID=A0A0P7GRZ1_9EURY|nr:hypothetical protein [Halolamina pelagica]KPN32129.1 hypothetical protein SY89_02889 [Halolamina pelagica]